MCNGVPHAHHLLPNVLWSLGWCCVMICVLILAYPKAKFGPVHGKLVVAAICKHPRGKSEFYRVSICLSSIHWLPLHHMRSYVDYCLLSHAVARRADREAHHGLS